jgi:hypothetical protein
MEIKDQNLWTVAQDFVLGPGFHMGLRMTVVKLHTGGLWVWSPIHLTADIQRELDAQGEVECIVAPNNFHHLFINDFLLRYPNAKLFVVPALLKKRPELKPLALIDQNFKSPWPEIDVLFFDAGASFQEAVFFHKQSRTLLLTDLAFNFEKPKNFLNALHHLLLGIYKKFTPSRLGKYFLRRIANARTNLDKIQHFDTQRIVVAHGDIIHEAGSIRFAEGFKKFLS